MIYGPVVMNAELICYKEDWDDVRVVGVGQGRKREQELASASYPQIERFEEITQKGILYSLEEGQIDGAIQDLTRAAGLPQMETKPLSDEDYISYVLVVDKEFARTQAFADLVKSYNRAAERLNDPSYLAEKLGVEESWLADKKIQFLTLDEVE